MPNGQRTWIDFPPMKTCVCGMLNHSAVSDSATSWTVDHQAPLSMEFSRQEYWSGLSFPTSGDLPGPGTEPMSPPLVDRFFTIRATREALWPERVEVFNQKSGLEFLHHLNFLRFLLFSFWKIKSRLFCTCLGFWNLVSQRKLPNIPSPLCNGSECSLSSRLLPTDTTHVFGCSDHPLPAWQHSLLSARL